MKYGWILVLIASFAVYSNSLNNGYHYDDEHSLQMNESIRSLANIPDFFVDPGTFSDDPSKGMFRPLLLVTFALNYAANQEWGLDGYDVRGYHLINLLLHAATAALLWWLVACATGRLDVALVGGLLFALHPLGTEPVNYISSRSEGQASFFYMLGLALFVRGSSRSQRGWIAASWAAAALGLLSKSTVITLPVVVLIHDYLFVARRQSDAFRQRLLRVHGPYWLISLIYVWLITANQFLTRSLQRPVRDKWSQFLIQSEAFSYYLKLLLWPTDLNVEHQFFARTTIEWMTAGAILLVATFLWGLYQLYRRGHDQAFFLATWGTLAVLPVVVVPLNVLVNERRIYLTCAAFCIGFALVLRSEWMRRRRLGPTDVGVIFAAIVALAYAGLTYERNGVWLNEFSLWRDSVAKAPLMPRSNLYLGNAYKEVAIRTKDKKVAEENWKLAAASYEEVRKVASNREHTDLALRALNNLGSVRFMLQDFDAAEKAYREAYRRNPYYADALVNIGNIDLVRGRRLRRDGQPMEKSVESWRKGVEHYSKALKLAPNHYAAFGMMGLTFYEMGQYAEALKAYKRAITINPGDYSTLANLGNFYVTQAILVREGGGDGASQLREAEAYYQRSFRANSARPEPGEGLKTIEEMRANFGIPK